MAEDSGYTPNYKPHDPDVDYDSDTSTPGDQGDQESDSVDFKESDSSGGSNITSSEQLEINTGNSEPTTNDSKVVASEPVNTTQAEATESDTVKKNGKILDEDQVISTKDKKGEKESIDQFQNRLKEIEKNNRGNKTGRQAGNILNTVKQGRNKYDQLDIITQDNTITVQGQNKTDKKPNQSVGDRLVDSNENRTSNNPSASFVGDALKESDYSAKQATRQRNKTQDLLQSATSQNIYDPSNYTSRNRDSGRILEQISNTASNTLQSITEDSRNTFRNRQTRMGFVPNTDPLLAGNNRTTQENTISLDQETRQDIDNLIESEGRTTLSVEEKARKGNLDNLEAYADIPFTGEYGEFTLTGAPAKAAASFDTFTSDQGFEQLSTAAPWVEKSGAQVMKENIVESGRDSSQFDLINETVETFSSPAGFLVGTGALGAGFKGTTATLAARGSKGAKAAKALELGGAAAGTAYTGLELEESRQDFKEGNNLEATENLLKLGTETIGFAGGARKASKALSPKITELPSGQKVSSGQNRIRLQQTGENTFQGGGQSKAEFNVEASRLAELLGTAKSGKGEIRAQYNILGGEGSSQSKGTLEIDIPGRDNVRRPFEALSINKGSGTTESGNEFTISRDVLETQDSGIFFRNNRERTGTSKNIKQSDSDQEIVNIGEDLALTENNRLIKTSSRSLSDKGDIESFSDSEIILEPGASSSSSSTGGSGGRVVGGGDSGSGQSLVSTQRLDVVGEIGGRPVSRDLLGREAADVVNIDGGSPVSGNTAGLSEELEQQASQRQPSNTQESQEQPIEIGPELVESEQVFEEEQILQEQRPKGTGSNLINSGREKNRAVFDSIDLSLTDLEQNQGTEPILDLRQRGVPDEDDKLGNPTRQKNPPENPTDTDLLTPPKLIQEEKPPIEQNPDTPKDTPFLPPFLEESGGSISGASQQRGESIFDQPGFQFKSSVGAELLGIEAENRPSQLSASNPLNLRPEIE